MKELVHSIFFLILFFSFTQVASAKGACQQNKILDSVPSDTSRYPVAQIRHENNNRSIDFFFQTHIPPGDRTIDEFIQKKTLKERTAFVRMKLKEKKKDLKTFRRNLKLLKNIFKTQKIDWIGLENISGEGTPYLGAQKQLLSDLDSAKDLRAYLMSHRLNNDSQLTNKEIENFVLVTHGSIVTLISRNRQLINGRKIRHTESQAMIEAHQISKKLFSSWSEKKKHCAKGGNKETCHLFTTLKNIYQKKYQKNKLQRDEDLVKIVSHYPGNGLILRGGGHQKNIEAYLRALCSKQNLQKPAELDKSETTPSRQ